MSRRLLAPQRGSATVWVLALAGLLAACGAAVVLVGAAMVARHRATAAADLAALAGAQQAVLGDPRSCAAASHVAIANGAVVDACSLDAGAVVSVRLHIAVRLGPLGVVHAYGRARAGPAGSAREDRAAAGPNRMTDDIEPIWRWARRRSRWR